MEKIENGNRLAPPSGCPRTIHRAMIKCCYVTSQIYVDRYTHEIIVHIILFSHHQSASYSYIIKLKGVGINVCYKMYENKE